MQVKTRTSGKGWILCSVEWLWVISMSQWKWEIPERYRDRDRGRDKDREAERERERKMDKFDLCISLDYLWVGPCNGFRRQFIIYQSALCGGGGAALSLSPNFIDKLFIAYVRPCARKFLRRYIFTLTRCTNTHVRVYCTIVSHLHSSSSTVFYSYPGHHACSSSPQRKRFVSERHARKYHLGAAAHRPLHARLTGHHRWRLVGRRGSVRVIFRIMGGRDAEFTSVCVIVKTTTISQRVVLSKRNFGLSVASHFEIGCSSCRLAIQIATTIVKLFILQRRFSQTEFVKNVQ